MAELKDFGAVKTWYETYKSVQEAEMKKPEDKEKDMEFSRNFVEPTEMMNSQEFNDLKAAYLAKKGKKKTEIKQEEIEEIKEEFLEKKGIKVIKQEVVALHANTDIHTSYQGQSTFPPSKQAFSATEEGRSMK